MHQTIPLSRVIDLTNSAGNRIYNMSVDEARALVTSGDGEAVGRIAWPAPSAGCCATSLPSITMGRF